MAIWADFDEDDEPSNTVVTSEGAIDGADQSDGYDNPSSYIAHALRCYPYEQYRWHKLTY